MSVNAGISEVISQKSIKAESSPFFFLKSVAHLLENWKVEPFFLKNAFFYLWKILYFKRILFKKRHINNRLALQEWVCNIFSEALSSRTYFLKIGLAFKKYNKNIRKIMHWFLLISKKSGFLRKNIRNFYVFFLWK